MTGKVRRIRRTRAALAVAAVLAVAAPISLLVLPGQGARSPSYAGTPVSQWPDRSRPEMQGVAAGAVALFEQNNPGSSEVRWLFRGQLGTTDQYLVSFLADKEGVPTVVVGRTQLSQVDSSGLGGQKEQGSFPWALYDAPVSSIKDQVAMFVHTSDATSPSALFPAQQVPDYRTTLFVVGDPSARRLTWSATPLPSAPTEATTSGVLTSSNGVFVSSPLRLNGLPSARLENSSGASGAPSALGLVDDQPNLVLPEPPVAQDSQRDLMGGSGPTSHNDDGTWAGAGYGNARDVPGRLTTTFVRCYGGGQLTVSLEANNPRPGESSISGQAACDGQTHEALSVRAAPSGDTSLRFTSDRLQVFSFVTRKG